MNAVPKPMPEAAGQWENVTPKKAELWLNTLNTNNRKLRVGVAEKYADDMKSGRWLRNPQPIIFYEDGSLADGQHRLFAIVEAGIPVRMYLVRGVPKDVALNIDTGLSRSLTDNAKLAGWDRPISHGIIAMAVMVHYGRRNLGRTFSNAQRLELIDKYEKHLTWAESNRPRGQRIGNAVIGAAIARAHMWESDLERLTEFCRVMDGQMPKQGDEAAHAFRTYVMVNEDLVRDARDLFLKAMNAIRYFMRRKSLTVIKGVKDEAYPLRGEAR